MNQYILNPLVLLIAVSTRFRLVARGDDPDRRLKFWGLTKLGKHGAMAVNLCAMAQSRFKAEKNRLIINFYKYGAMAIN
jgi:hypothetical protein